MVTSITGTKTSLEDLVKPLKSTEFAQTLKSAADLITGFVDASKKGAGAASGLNFGIGTGVPTPVTAPVSSSPLITNGLYVTVRTGTPIGIAGTPYFTAGNINADANTITATKPVVFSAQDKVAIVSLAAAGGLPAWFGTSKSLQELFNPRAAGGPVSAMSTYLVGEKGPELFTPRSGGTIIPNTALQGYTTSGSSSSGSSSANGNNFNINVYNPTPEAASDSIGRTMRNLSYTGLFG
jgi:hypothetical protein